MKFSCYTLKVPVILVGSSKVNEHRCTSTVLLMLNTPEEQLHNIVDGLN